MPIKVGDVLMYLGLETDEFKTAFAQVQTDVKKQSDQMSAKFKDIQTGLRLMGAGMTAAGVAGLAMVESSRKVNAELATTALNLGVSQKEMRNLALSVTSVDSPLNEVVKTFDLLARAGVKNPETLKANAGAFDDLADATGNTANQIAEMLIPAYKALGEELPRTSNEMDKFTWLTRNTMVNLDEFASVMTYVAKDGKALNLTSKDIVATLAVLESRGITGAAATRTFRTAVSEAVTNNKSLNDVLGITQTEIDGFSTKIDSATGLTKKYADAANTQFGIMANLKQLWSEITLRVGSALQPFEAVLGLMSALGPAMIFLSAKLGQDTIKWVAHSAAVVWHTVVTKAATVAQWLWNAALSANPIGIALIALGALATAFGIYKAVTGNAKTSTDQLNASVKNYEPPINTAVAKTEAWKNALIELGRLQKTTSSNTSQLTSIAKYYLDNSGIYIEAMTRDMDGISKTIDKSSSAYARYQTALKGPTEANKKYADSLIGKRNLSEEENYWLELYYVQLKKVTDAQQINIDQKQKLVDWQSKINGLAEVQEAAATKAGKLSISLDDVAKYMIATGRAAELASIPTEQLANVSKNAQSLSEYFKLDPSVVFQWMQETAAIQDATTKAESSAKAIQTVRDNVKSLGQQYDYSNTTAGKLGVTFDSMTGYLLDHGKSAEDIIKIYDQWGTDANVVFNKLGTGLQDVAKWSEQTRDQMLSDMQDYTNKANQAVADAVQAEKDAIDTETKARDKLHQSKLNDIQDEYNATVKYIDAHLKAVVAGYNKEIAAIDAALKGLDDADKAREDAKSKASLESQIANETDSSEKANLNKQLDDLILQSGNETWQEERKLALQKQIEEAVYSQDKINAQTELEDYLLELEEASQRAELNNQKNTLLDKIAASQAAAETERQDAQNTYDYKKNLEDLAWTNFQTTQEAKKTALDNDLIAAQKRYDGDLLSFQTLCSNKLTETDALVTEYNKLVDQMNRDVTITIHTVRTGSSGQTPGSSPEPVNEVISGMPQFAKGGLVKARPGGQLILAGEGGEDEVITPVSKLKQLFRSLISGFAIPEGLTAAPLIANAGALGNSINNYNSSSQGGDTYISFQIDRVNASDSRDVDKFMDAVVSKLRLKGMRF